MTTLPDGVFHGLTTLEELSLSDNLLTTLPEGVFHGLTSLSDLRLGANQLTTLSAGVFDGLTSLQWLSRGKFTHAQRDDDFLLDMIRRIRKHE